MPQIQQLPAHIADLIAAGEVVERPASVCKELLENALDAGASAVSVELEHGGMTYLRVTDNGCGIAPEQLPTAFLRHATSKLRRAEDLAAIGTLGFRGEALAAIAAVSRLDIFSRARGADSGASLHLEGGVPGEVTAAGCPEGTTVCVRDLFYNTPARMKFMKKDSAEGAAAAAVVTQLALSHPEVSFKLLRDGQEVLHTPGDGQLLSAIYAALGRDFAKSLLEVNGGSGDVRASGFVSSPAAGHGTRARQLFFVNGRLVKSQLLTAAVEEAYRNRLLKGKFPGCVLHITLPVNEVDVNVHPAKTVVKFAAEKDRDERQQREVADTQGDAAGRKERGDESGVRRGALHRERRAGRRGAAKSGGKALLSDHDGTGIPETTGCAKAFAGGDAAHGEDHRLGTRKTGGYGAGQTRSRPGYAGDGRSGCGAGAGQAVYGAGRAGRGVSHHTAGGPHTGGGNGGTTGDDALPCPGRGAGAAGDRHAGGPRRGGAALARGG